MHKAPPIDQSCIYISTTKAAWRKVKCGQKVAQNTFRNGAYKEWDEYRSHVAKTGPKYDVSEWFCLGSCAGVKRVVGGARCQNIPKTWCISNQAWHSAQSSDGPTRIIIQVSHCWNLDLHFEKLHQKNFHVNRKQMCAWCKGIFFNFPMLFFPNQYYELTLYIRLNLARNILFRS